jgi:hypothetical protein
MALSGATMPPKPVRMLVTLIPIAFLHSRSTVAFGQSRHQTGDKGRLHRSKNDR